MERYRQRINHQYLNQLVIKYQNKPEKALLEEIISMCSHHINKLSNNYSKLPYSNFRITVEDLIQEGTIVLIKTIKRYNYDKKENFFSFFIGRLNTWMITIFLKNRELLTDKNFAFRRRNFPTIKNIDSELEEAIEVQNLISLEIYLPNLLSLEYITDYHVASPEKKYLMSEVIKSLDISLAKLSERERFVIEKRFLEDLTLQELAKLLGVTRERVRQICEKALNKLRFWLRNLARDFSEASFSY